MSDPQKTRSADIPFNQPVRLLLHGEEHEALGGPSVRVPRTAEVLRSLGVPAQAGVFCATSFMAREIPEDVVHLFNVWPPASALHALRTLKRAGKTVVFSPIYLDLHERAFWQTALPDIAHKDLDDLAKTYAAFRTFMQTRGRLDEIMPGYNAMLREMISLADHILLLSKTEQDALSALGADVRDIRTSLISNPVNADKWAGGDPEIFRKAHLDALPGPDDYIICVGRIEERKNQLLLARAVRDLPVRLVLVGHAGNPDYAEKLGRVAGPNILRLGRIEPGSDMLRSALTGASAFVLPSWAEGAALAALEAAACGTDLVLSDRSSETAYFGDLARYCDPGDPLSIRAAIQQTLNDNRDPEQKAARKDALQALVRAHYGWPQHARDTANAYAQALTSANEATPAKPVDAIRQMQHLAIDITPLAEARIADRAIVRLAEGLAAGATPVTLIFWNAVRDAFVSLPERFTDIAQALQYCRTADAGSADIPVALPPDCALVILGSLWQSDAPYLNALEDLKNRFECSIIALLQNAGPLAAPFRYDAHSAALFRQGALRLAGLADGIITPTQEIADTLTRAIAAAHQPAVEIDVANPAALDLGLIETPQTEETDLPFDVPRFVLNVGDMDRHSNQEMLCEIWSRLASDDNLADLHLVIAGGPGNAMDALRDRMTRDQNLNGRTHFVTDISTANLARLYQSCLFTLQPGFGAGWALPVFESLNHGKLCIASTMTALPEDAETLIERIDPDDLSQWAARIADFGTDTAARHAREAQIRADYTAPPPPGIAAAVAEIALRARPVRLRRENFVGEPLSASSGAPPLSITYGDGWHPAEPETRWAGAADARLGLRAKGDWSSDSARLRVLLKLDAHIPDGHRVPFRITCGDSILFESPVSREDFPSDVMVTVPASEIRGDGSFDLDLHLPPSQTPYDPPNPTRRTGIGLGSAILLASGLSNPLMYLSKPQNWSMGDFALTADMSDPAHRNIVAPGLAFSPAWGVGSRDGAIDLKVPVLPGAGAHALTLTLRPIAAPDRPVSASILWNGRLLDTRVWSDDMPDTFTLPLSKADLDICAPAIVSIQCGSVLTPADIGVGTTTSHAGLGVTDLVLMPKDQI